MSIKAVSISPVVVALYKPDVTEDLQGNRLIKAVVRVYFPTMKQLRDTMNSFQKETLIGLKCLWKTVGDQMNATKSILFSTGVCAVRKFVEEGSRPLLDLGNSSLDTSDNTDSHLNANSSETTVSELPEMPPALYPTIVTISEISLKSWGETPVIQSVLGIHLVGEDDLIPIARSILTKDPKTEMEIHLAQDGDNNAVIDFMIAEISKSRLENSNSTLSDSSSSLASVLSTITPDYFSSKGGVKDKAAQEIS